MTADPAPKASTSILLVEDHASYRQALVAVMLVERDLEVIAQVERAEDAGPAAAATTPTVALVDLDLPGASGIEAITAIRDGSPDTACILLSALTDDLQFGRAIQAGASAVLHKSVEIPELLRVLRLVADGGAFLPPAETTRRLQAVARAQDRDWHARLLERTLTGRERQVLDLLAEGHGNRQIAKKLHISPDTVQTHIRNMLTKLGVGSRLEAVVKALRLGLVAPPG